MIKSATSLTSSGVRDWLVQRVSAVILALYVIFLFAYLIFHPHLNYVDWQALFSHWTMRMFTFFALVSLVLHSWVGIWTVLTDYVKWTTGRLFLEVIMVFALLGYLAWGVVILWQL